MFPAVNGGDSSGDTGRNASLDRIPVNERVEAVNGVVLLDYADIKPNINHAPVPSFPDIVWSIPL